MTFLQCKLMLGLILLQTQVLVCEAQATTNIALGKPVSMSSQYNGASAGSNAVNGVTTGLWNDGCASTQKQNDPWLEIDLGAIHTISSVILYNRIDCYSCPDRLRDVSIEISDDQATYNQIAYQGPAIGTSMTFTFGSGVSGRYLKISLGVNEYLTLCEVEVIGQIGPVDGGWSDYGEWTECTRSCGTGMHSRSRTCTNPPPSPGGADCVGYAIEESVCNTHQCPTDCQDYENLGRGSGVYRVYPGGAHEGFDVYCDMDTEGCGWTVFQRRLNGTEEFFRDWADYRLGFGDVSGEHWLGNDNLYYIVSQYPSLYKLRVDLEDFEGNSSYAEYYDFNIGSNADKYRLMAASYSGNAGDSLSYHSGQQFSTKDGGPRQSCANTYKGAWWYKSCHKSNLNGFYYGGSHTSYADGIEWFHWTGYYYSLKTTEMKIKRKI